MNMWTDTVTAYQNYHRLDSTQAHLFHLLGMLVEPEFGPEVAAAMLDIGQRPARAMMEKLVEAQLLTRTKEGTYKMTVKQRRISQDGLETEPLEVQTAARMQVIRWYSSMLNSDPNPVDEDLAKRETQELNALPSGDTP